MEEQLEVDGLQLKIQTFYKISLMILFHYVIFIDFKFILQFFNFQMNETENVVFDLYLSIHFRKS